VFCTNIHVYLSHLTTVVITTDFVIFMDFFNRVHFLTVPAPLSVVTVAHIRASIFENEETFVDVLSILFPLNFIFFRRCWTRQWITFLIVLISCSEKLTLGKLKQTHLFQMMMVSD
jgi:hypothetical protein